ncbi:MAG: ABC transporter substrate-binding protein [Dehalococcoidales bacterium]|nr:ABC transporter substrate-binding protein [Dehalococcoidales bacterium]
MDKKMGRQLARRDFIKLAVVGGLGVGLTGALAACQPAAAPAPTSAPSSGQPAAQPTQAPAKSGGKVTLQIWQHWAGGLEKVFRDQIDTFNKSQNEIEIQVTTIPLADQWTKVLAAIAAGSPPDTYTSAAMIRPELLRDGHLDSLDTYMKWPDDMFKTYDPQTLMGGTRVGVPINGGLWTIFCNLDLYKAAGLDTAKLPATWDDVLEQGKKLTDASKNQFGLVLPNKPFSWTTEVWYGFLLSAGGDFLTPDNSEAAFNSDAGVQALQYWVDAFNTSKIAPLVTMDNAAIITNYQTGKIGMMPMYPVQMGAVAGFKHKSMTVPAPTKKTKGTHFAGTYFPFMKGSKNKEAVATFFKWWVQPENQAKWAAGTGGLPISTGVTSTDTYKKFLKDQPMAQAFLDSMDFAKPLPMVVGISDMEQIVSEAIEEAVYKKSSPKDALDAAAQKVNDVIKKNKS